jgi:hypothetical protein
MKLFYPKAEMQFPAPSSAFHPAGTRGRRWSGDRGGCSFGVGDFFQTFVVA